MKASIEKLNTLTSLRFLAAAMIVFFHFDGLFGVPDFIRTSFHLNHAVSFFFILSGFILAYAYPSFKNLEDKKRFWIARIARIWPAHCLFFLVISLLSVFGLMAVLGGRKNAILNLLMLQGWIPIQYSYFSYNAVSWSISTEFFFYLCFPFIIYRWSKTWFYKTIIIFSIPFILMFASTYFQLPDYSPDHLFRITNHGVLYINPLARLPEFLLGILTANLWMKYKNQIQRNYLLGTVMEFVAIALLLLNLYYYEQIQGLTLKIIPQNIEHEFGIWTGLTGNLACLSFMLLIMMFAQQAGLISTILSFRLSVILGEISFSIYLMHQIINRFYSPRAVLFENIPNEIQFMVYWLILLTCSYLIWKFVECPIRNFILNIYSQKQLLKKELIINVND